VRDEAYGPSPHLPFKFSSFEAKIEEAGLMSSFSVKVFVLISLTVSALVFAIKNHSTIPATNQEPVELPTNCDISKSKCGFTIPAIGSGQVEIRPLPLKSAQRFSISVSNLTFQPQKIEVDLERIDSPIDYQKPALLPSADGYAVETVFPTCTVDRMPWKMTLQISTPKGLYEIPWKFEVSRK
jgi:hypothetical protein